MQQKEPRPAICVADHPLTDVQQALCAFHLRAFCWNTNFRTARVEDLAANDRDMPQAGFASRKIEAMLVSHHDCVRAVVTATGTPKKKWIGALRDCYLEWLQSVAKAQHCLHGHSLGDVPGLDVYDLESHCVSVSPIDGSSVRLEIAHGTRDDLAYWLARVAEADYARVIEALQELADAPLYQRSAFTLDAQEIMNGLLDQ